jgi:hypothetical protein
MKAQDESTRVMDQEVSRLMSDGQFAQRLASRVQSKANRQGRYRMGAALAAAGIAIALGVTLFDREVSPPGLHSESSDLLAAQETSQLPWEDTDAIISSALASR